MRTLQTTIVGLTLTILLAGCAHQKPLVTVKPTQEELPNIPELQSSATQVSSRVEGQWQETRLTLVPEYKEPELTPEERAAVGEDAPPYQPLLYPWAAAPRDSLTQPAVGGIEVYVSGRGTGEVYRDYAKTLSFAGPDWGGPAVWTDPFTVRPGAVYYQIPDSAYAGGPDGGPEVGYERAEQSATHERTHRK